MHVTEYLKENNIKSPYLKYAKSVFCMGGGDGILEKLLSELEVDSGVLVEFGALDAISYSTTYNVWKNNSNFNVVLIEADTKYAEEMLSLVQTKDNVECMNCFVSPEVGNEYSLDSLLDQSDFEITNDNLIVVSIDVDSCDHAIFESITKYRPYIFIVETNTNYSPDVDYIGTGASLKSMNDVAVKKGYSLVVSTGNAYFVRNDLLDKLTEYNPELTLEDYYFDTEHVDKCIQRVDENGDILDHLRWASVEYKDSVKNEKQLLLGLK